MGPTPFRGPRRSARTGLRIACRTATARARNVGRRLRADAAAIVLGVACVALGAPAACGGTPSAQWAAGPVPSSPAASASTTAALTPPPPAPEPWPCPTEGDVDGDGAADHLVATERGWLVRTASAELPIPLPAAAIVRACVGDLQGDGRADLVVGVVRTTDSDPSFRQRLYLYRARDRRLEPLFLGTAGAGTLLHFGLAPLGDDGTLKVVARERGPQGTATRIYRWASPGLTEDAALAALAPPYRYGPPVPAAPRFTDPSVPAGVRLPELAPAWRRSDASFPDLVLSPTLGNVVNRGKFHWLDGEARRQLQRDGFVVVRPPNGPEQFHSLYLQNQYDDIPSYVTADAVLYALHLLLDETLLSAEIELLGPLTAQLVASLRAQARELRPRLPPALLPSLDRLRLRLDVAAALLEAGPSVVGADEPADWAAAVAEELGAIERRAGASRRLPGVEYSQFLVRGHYTKGPAAGRYFRATLLLAQPIGDPTEAALLTAMVLADPGAARTLAMLDEFGRAFVGPPAVATPLSAAAAARAAFGAEPSWGDLATKTGWLAASTVPARPGAPAAGAFALLARRWPVDNDLLAAGATGDHLPDPLALCASLGSVQARARLAALPGVGTAELARVDEAAAQLRSGKAGDRASVGGRLLLALRWLLLPYPEGYPAHQRAQSWADHVLVTAAATWASWRRDTVLLVEPPIRWMEGAEADALPPGRTGFVEPVPELYAELGAVLDAVDAMLRHAGLGAAPASRRVAAVVDRARAFRALLGALEQASRDELVGKPLSAEQHERLSSFGHEIEQLFADDGKLLLDPVPVVADVFYLRDPARSQPDQVLLVGTGPPDVLTVAVPVGSRVLFARGAVHSFYQQVATEPMTDEQWREAIRLGTGPLEPVWARPVRATRAMPSLAPRDDDGEDVRFRSFD